MTSFFLELVPGARLCRSTFKTPEFSQVHNTWPDVKGEGSGPLAGRGMHE